MDTSCYYLYIGGGDVWAVAVAEARASFPVDAEIGFELYAGIGHKFDRSLVYA